MIWFTPLQSKMSLTDILVTIALVTTHPYSPPTPTHGMTHLYQLHTSYYTNYTNLNVKTFPVMELYWEYHGNFKKQNHTSLEHWSNRKMVACYFLPLSINGTLNFIISHLIKIDAYSYSYWCSKSYTFTDFHLLKNLDLEYLLDLKDFFSYMQWKSLLTKHWVGFIPYSQCHGCCWFGTVGGRDIRSYDIAL